jgi:GPH family glycoside/pentoside/hexuronide:cation symporter
LAAVGFVANTELTESAMNGIHWMTTLLPAILFIAGGVLMIFYKLDKTLLDKIEIELLERRQKGDLNPETN